MPAPFLSAADEIAAELGDEIDCGDGSRLPLVPGAYEIRELLGLLSSPHVMIARLMYASGLRLDEALELHTEQVDWERRSLSVGRVAYCDPATIEALRAIAPADAAKFFTGTTTEEFAEVVRSAAEHTGLAAKYQGVGRRFTPLCFRHAFGAHRLENGLSMLSLRKLMGHQFLETTYMYVASAVGRYRAAYDAALLLP